MAEIKEKIDGHDVTFPQLGTSTILLATQKVREISMRPCRDIMACLNGSSLEFIVGQVNAAVEAVMRHMVPSRREIFDWLQTDEGAVFLIEESLKKDKNNKSKAVDIYDKMDLDQIDRVQSSLLSSIARRPETENATKELIDKLMSEVEPEKQDPVTQ